MPKRVTLQDVAKAAGVSAATVSRVGRGNVKVSPEVETLVRSSAQKLGFSLSEHTDINIVGFLMSNVGQLHPFNPRILFGAEEFFDSHDYNMMLLTLRYNPRVDLEDLHMPAILRRRSLVRGYALAGRVSPNLLEFFWRRGIPSAVLGNHVLKEFQEDRDVVWFDDIQGAYELTRFLQSLGHRNIWFVGDGRSTWCTRRHKGYVQAMADAGLTPQQSKIDSDDYFELGFLSTKSALSRDRSLTAIFAANDLVAQGVYMALSDCGLRVPEDVSVAGFDDTEAAFMHPPLTSVRIFVDQIGRELASTLLKRIKHPELAPQQNVIPTQLVKRASHRSLRGEPQNESEAGEQGEPINFVGTRG